VAQQPQQQPNAGRCRPTLSCSFTRDTILAPAYRWRRPAHD
jgi:hypothetical protein